MHEIATPVATLQAEPAELSRLLRLGCTNITRPLDAPETADWPDGYVLGVNKGVWGIHEHAEDFEAKIWRGPCPWGKPGDTITVQAGDHSANAIVSNVTLSRAGRGYVWSFGLVRSPQ